MADSHANMTKTSPQEVIVSVVLGLVAPLLAIGLVLALVNRIQSDQIDADKPEIAEQTILKNIAPVAQLEAVDANAPKVEKSGEEVFNAVCTSCHTSGALGAPKLNNKGDWASRLGQGFEKLTANAVNGIRGMPPRGGNPDLSDAEIARAVAYMANSAGAKFKAAEAGTSSEPVAAPIAEAAAPAAPATAKASMASEPASGKGVYDASCAACHGTGVAGAPKLGDKAAWASRVKTGSDALYASAIKGKGAMPAKGGNAGMSEADVRAAVDYMVGQAK
jgi:cytochrome c5